MASRSETARQMPQEQVFVPEKPVVPAVFARLWTNRGQILFGLDLSICLVCFIGAYYVRFYLDLPGDEIFGLSVPSPSVRPLPEGVRPMGGDVGLSTLEGPELPK